ncbi:MULTISPECIES: hypothetical protein [Rhizobium]|uniref:Uncharacterized protein n=1 Tax=Rhizobium tropici TaxID=398 RepID=A0A6P1CAF4_RHITR|nr:MULTISPECIES: hypothetical protein [Rhizobium]AGB69708.1 hypothetical protein RTCIAT899_CH01445 [Rhizobium tropici CIAT 899]MBB4244090.1 hypothetical protein [Rhizobium tropici]MBB5595073.1 hypothetical protein [Rhizobium tropici]MBB6494429.1 hypothetical protein [Rhizobium tropici]NEV12573.1 hypothetical protein [Rhizobium tropici]
MSFYRNGTLLLAAFLLSAPASHAATTQDDPSKIDLAKLIECTTYDVPSYNNFALWLTGPESAKAMKQFGISELPSDNPFLREFRLSMPLSVFGRRTNRIVFTSTGPLAVLDEADPHSLAKQLGVTASVDQPNKFLGEKVVLSHKDQQANSDTVLETRISLNVSTVDTHPGKTLAGCSYSIEVE